MEDKTKSGRAKTQPITKRTRPDLDWAAQPSVFWIVRELIQSDAYRDLTKVESDILLWVLSRRKYPSNREKKKNPRNYWEPLNGHTITIPYVAIEEFFSQMGGDPPVPSTITRAINNFMRIGILAPVSIGGRGKGDMSTYRLSHEWRVWRKGDPAVYTKAGMSNVKGFCYPGSETFCPARNLKKGCEPA